MTQKGEWHGGINQGCLCHPSNRRWRLRQNAPHSGYLTNMQGLGALSLRAFPTILEAEGVSTMEV